MKKIIFTIISFCFFLAYSYAFAGIECINKVSNSVSTPNFHCEKHCSNWANDVPMQTLTLDMDKKFKDMNAFFKNATSSCSGGGLCGFSSIPPTGAISPNGEQVNLSFKTWSRPVVVTISADICIFNNAVPPAPATIVIPTPPISSVPPVLTSPAAVKPQIPPQKMHDIEEAGALGDNCNRMKDNWLVDAKNYCSPYNVNLVSINLICSQSADALFRKVSGIFLCT